MAVIIIRAAYNELVTNAWFCLHSGMCTIGLGKVNGREAYEGYTKVKSTVFNHGPVPYWFDDGVEAARYG